MPFQIPHETPTLRLDHGEPPRTTTFRALHITAPSGFAGDVQLLKDGESLDHIESVDLVIRPNEPIRATLVAACVPLNLLAKDVTVDLSRAIGANMRWRYQNLAAMLEHYADAYQASSWGDLFGDLLRFLVDVGPLPFTVREVEEQVAKRTPLASEAPPAIAADNPMDRYTVAQPLAEYHDDHGSVLWWLWPVCQPPFCGTPSDSDWPFDDDDAPALYWTPVIVPTVVVDVAAPDQETALPGGAHEVVG